MDEIESSLASWPWLREYLISQKNKHIIQTHEQLDDAQAHNYNNNRKIAPLVNSWLFNKI